MDPLQVVELTAVTFNLVYVILAVRRNILCWPFGIVGCGISVWYLHDIGLMAESFLNIYYVGMGIYGWWAWSNSSKGERPIAVFLPKVHLVIIAFGVMVSLFLGYGLSKWPEADLTYFDSFTTIFAFIATWLTARKVLENWVYWIVVDLASIALYSMKDSFFYAVLFLIYSAMAMYGFYQWRNAYRKQVANQQ